MNISSKTLTKLRELINEGTEYRSGPQLVKFFNALGFNDVYLKQGFPSRWAYTEEKLGILNGTPELDKCIREVFSPINFVGRFDELKKYIKDFNKYLAFDGWQVVQKGKDITFAKAGEINFETEQTTEESLFLKQEFVDIPLSKLGLEPNLLLVLEQRLDEIKQAHTAGASLSVIFLAGSTLEGILLGIASKNPRIFNESNKSPKDNNGKVKKLYAWSLCELIEAASSIGLLREDVRKFSHELRDFRNYIHPMQQMLSNFYPDEHTAKICLQVLKAAIHQLQSPSSG